MKIFSQAMLSKFLSLYTVYIYLIFTFKFGCLSIDTIIQFNQAEESGSYDIDFREEMGLTKIERPSATSNYRKTLNIEYICFYNIFTSKNISFFLFLCNATGMLARSENYHCFCSSHNKI
jgi:hypothetical protein